MKWKNKFNFSQKSSGNVVCKEKFSREGLKK